MPLDFGATAGRNAAHFWRESRLFEVLGGWVTSTPETSVKLMLDRHSSHHSWRATQWWERLPVVADVDRALLVADAASGPWPAALEEAEGLEGSVARLAAAYRVLLPRLAADYARHRGAASPAADGSTLRTLAIVGDDLVSDWVEGELALQSLVTSASDARLAAATVARLEALICPTATAGED